MVENCFAVAVFCICGALIAVILKQYCSEHSMLLAIGASASVLTAFVVLIEPEVSELREMFESAGVSESFISLMFKALAICCITHITAELCRDSGEGAIASAAELWGRGALAVLSLPLVHYFLQLINVIIKE
ncbi:stage III sporulation AC/AD family protein [Ruminococcus flavefaciens]|uniref:stage III sporulation AC/AD family protein n=1 Tax=Ruminococcus flavefaciens TaxID=1265 RepID=UPI0026F378C8|nr:stage III sporulation AC/AD family protein [Ruminococcus flavefaciens]MDD7517177.1 stage III sporulation AC/AD family protein [Ruminococcus flavefaciens]MDY5690093.1 stage III sporulation AC/AD family protein [Ruminococcus flavefaciens]